MGVPPEECLKAPKSVLFQARSLVTGDILAVPVTRYSLYQGWRACIVQDCTERPIANSTDLSPHGDWLEVRVKES